MKKNYLKLFSSLLLCIVLVGCVYEYKDTKHQEKKVQDVSITIKGSTTIQPLMKALGEKFSANPHHPKVNISATGSIEGFRNLLNDSADLAMSSNKISPEIKQAFRKKKKHYAEYLLAGDALVFVVNVNNKIKKLTQQQLLDIFDGKITNWIQLGGENLPIKIASRDQTSGTYAFFKDIFLKKEHLAPTVSYYKTNREVLNAVKNDKSVIAYTNFSSLDYSIDPISISFDNTLINYVAPRVETVNNMSYKYFRGLYLYYNPDKFQKIKGFIDMLHADSTHQFIEQSGFITVNEKLLMK